DQEEIPPLLFYFFCQSFESFRKHTSHSKLVDKKVKSFSSQCLECSSCRTLYTRDCVCSKGNVEDKILVLKPPKNCARCIRCGYLVDGPNCQGCALLRQKLEENLVTHFQDFQNTSEPSNASTNVVNAPREPYVVKQDNGSFVDKIIFDLNRAPDSPHLHTISLNKFRCFHCKDVLREGEACKRCTCAKCGSGLGKGLCYICGHNQNSLNDSPRIFETSSQSPSHITHCCYECGDPLDGIFCKRCICKSCGKDAHIGYNCPPTVLVSSNPKPCNNQTIDELPQRLPSFHPTCHSEAESPFTLDSTPTYVDESPNVFNPPPQPPPCYNQGFNFPQDFQNVPQQYPCCDDCGVTHDAYQSPVCYDDDDDEERSDSLSDNIIFGLLSFSAITPNEPVLSPEEPDNSLSMGNEHLDTIPATESDELIKSSVENLVPIPSESEGIPGTMCDVHLVTNPTPIEAKDHFEIAINSNNDYSSSDDASFYNENIKYVEASPHDSKLVSLEVAEIVIPEDEEIEDDNLREKLLKSSSTFPKSVLEETNTFDDSLPEFENFCFYLEEISSGSTTTHSDISLSDYEAFSFYDGHIKEISSGSTTTHSNISLSEYDSFIFDLSNDQCPHTDRSDFTHEEFADELAHIISPPEYDCFYFRDLPDPGELISSLNSGTRENLSSTTCVNLPVEDDHSPLLAYVVWIFLACLTYPVILPHLHSFENENTIFDPGITINRFYSFKSGLSHRCGSVKKFNTHRSHLNECPMMINGKNIPLLDEMVKPVNDVLAQSVEVVLAKDFVIFLEIIKILQVFLKILHKVLRISTIVAMNNIIFGLPLCSAITPNEPVLSTEEPDNSLSMGDEHLDTISATELDEVIKSSVENLIPIPSESEGIPEHMFDVPCHDNSLPLDVSKDQFEDFFESNEEFSSPDDDSFSIDNIDYVEASPPESELVRLEVMEIVIPEVGGTDDDILLTIKDDILREKLLNVNLLIAKIEALNDNLTPSFDCKTKSSSTSLNPLLEETNTSDNSLPEFETFCFDVEEIISGYEVFYDDHVKVISSGSPTTHSDSFLYASFIFDLSNNLFPPADRNDFYEFTDELIPFISPPEYDCFLFKIEPNSRDFTKDVVKDISPNKEPQVHNDLPTHLTLQLNLKFQPSSESLFTYVVWIFLPFLENDHRGVDLNTETDKVNSPLVHTKVMNNSQKVHENTTSNEESAFNYSHNAHNGGSILKALDDMIRVGQSMGYAIKGCMKDIEHIIGTQGVDAGNSNYQYVSSDSAGSSGGILCVWETTIFKKDYATVSDNFIAIYGNWISNNSKDKKLQQSGAINSIKEDLIDIDENLDSGNVSDEILLKRMELTLQLHDINQMEARDYVQKSKIKWAIEGDENLKFFHDVFKDHFATRFKQHAHGRLKLNISFPNRLSTYQVADMDRSVSQDEVRVTVWNCGENKSPGPDGYTFEFFRRYWRATSDGLFKGIQIQGSMAISHLFYADDAVFIGEWSDSNMDSKVKILKCFFFASGLKINI
nr:RNA-directed DNA polymerase, eukaryota [Tanacetum cinerariifolium]